MQKHTHTDANKDSEEYSIVAFCKNATRIYIISVVELAGITNNWDARALPSLHNGAILGNSGPWTSCRTLCVHQGKINRLNY